MNINYLNFTNTTVYHSGRVPFFTFKNFEKLDFIRYGFSTRLGGVSKGDFSTMNLSFTLSDEPDRVGENFRLMGAALNIDCEDMIYAMQTHTANVMAVNHTHKGMGIIKERNFRDVDGLITNEEGICLVTGHADCVPVFLADPVRRAIGLSHAGWKGTVSDIAGATVKAMGECYGCKPADMVAFIGPSICRDCYEIGADVAEKFAEAYGKLVFDDILFPEASGKFKLDLHRANFHNLLNAGLKEENIGLTDVCTCCNPDLLFSHRASHGKRGGMCGFLQIK